MMEYEEQDGMQNMRSLLKVDAMYVKYLKMTCVT